VKRGEIWIAAGQGYVSKPRPVVVLQSAVFPRESSVTICPISADERSAQAPLLRVQLPFGGETGLARDSWAMVDKITTIRVDSLDKRIGHLPPRAMQSVSRAAAVFLGLAD
jgi:mRNA-degrading endonuclease toxin of MazEF toxin-antitoxin module